MISAQHKWQHCRASRSHSALALGSYGLLLSGKESTTRQAPSLSTGQGSGRRATKPRSVGNAPRSRGRSGMICLVVAARVCKNEAVTWTQLPRRGGRAPRREGVRRTLAAPRARPGLTLTGQKGKRAKKGRGGRRALAAPRARPGLTQGKGAKGQKGKEGKGGGERWLLRALGRG
jgi:hypothetical protein